MKDSFLFYRTGFILTGITLVFVIGALAGAQFTTPSPDSSDSGLLTDLKTAIAPDALAGWNSGGAYWADDYQSWPSSTTLRSDDTLARILDAAGRSITRFTTMDINGDGLQDILYTAGSSTLSGVIFLNNGDLTFSLAYKCHFNNTKYYGDCAAI